MNLVKWIRRNDRKVMAIVVIILLGGFVFQAFLSQCRQQRTTRRKTVAYFDDNSKITNYDIALARRELETLKLLKADVILRGIAVPIFRTLDLQSIMLAGLIFPDRTTAPLSVQDVKQMIAANSYIVNEKQINDVHRHSMPSEIYWILLKKEAQLAGIKISDEISRNQLTQTIPQLFNGATYSPVISTVASQQGVSEEEIIETFGNLIAVLRYADFICTSENLTNAQMRHEISWEDETIDIEFVKFNSSLFEDAVDEPSEQEINQQFNNYREFFEGDITDENPYGFGYKLHDRVQLEYIAVKLDDVKNIVTAPTQEDVEEYYQRHREELTESIPSDPNDPNSPQTQRIKTYGEVASTISQNLLNNKIDSKAESIIMEARSLTELGLEDIDVDPEEITTEQLRKIAGDYKIAAEQLSTKYKINLYAEKTAMLNALDMVTDKYLGTMFTKGYGNNPVPLIKIAFAADDLNSSELGPFDAPKPKLYENIGPAQDIRAQIIMLVRVIEAQKAFVPENINQTIASASLELGEQQKTSSVKDLVVKDLKNLVAMDTAKSKAEEFIKLAEKNGWENTIDEFNKLYADSKKPDGEDQDELKLQHLADVQRISDKGIDTLIMKKDYSPTKWWLVNEVKIERLLIDRLHALIPEDSNTPETLPVVLEFKPDKSCYCLKALTVNRLDRQQYNTIKAARTYREDFLQSQSLAPVHFNPENILKRMNFRMAKEDKTSADVNTPPEDESGL